MLVVIFCNLNNFLVAELEKDPNVTGTFWICFQNSLEPFHHFTLTHLAVSKVSPVESLHLVICPIPTEAMDLEILQNHRECLFFMFSEL